MSALANENKTIQQLLEEEKEEFRLEIANKKPKFYCLNGNDENIFGIPVFLTIETSYTNGKTREKCSLDVAYAIMDEDTVIYKIFLASICKYLRSESFGSGYPVSFYRHFKKEFDKNGSSINVFTFPNNFTETGSDKDWFIYDCKALRK
jgi:hypothetical protein